MELHGITPSGEIKVTAPTFLHKMKNLFAGRPNKDCATAGPNLLDVPGDIAFLHVTHQKAGSQWIRGILQEAFGSNVVYPRINTEHVVTRPVTTGKVYACVYLSKMELESICLPEKVRRAVLIRDLRDTLVSGYYSLRNSHAVMNDRLAKIKATLQHVDRETGLLYLMDVWLNNSAHIQRSWAETTPRCLKLEDFMRDPLESFKIWFADRWQMEVPEELLQRLLDKHSFARLTGGRDRGHEDVNAHYRKGVQGDWKQHFTPKVKERFKHLYNDVLLAAGYEEDSAW